MSKDKSETLKIGGIKIPQWLVTIVSSLITSLLVGYFTLQASLQPVQLQIYATQTAESRIISTPVVNISVSPTSQQAIPTESHAPTNTNYTSQPPSSHTSYVQGYYFLFALWIIIAIANTNQRKHLSKQLSKILSKPTIPIATTLKNYLQEKNKLNPSAFLEDIVSLILLLVFLLGVVVETIHSNNPTFYSNNVPGSLMVFLIVFGSITAPTIGAWKIASRNFLNKDPLWKRIILVCSVYLFISGTLLLILLSIARLNLQARLPEPYYTWLYQTNLIMSTIFLPLNYLFGSIVVAIDGFSGFLIVLASLSFVAIIAVEVLIKIFISYIYIASFVLITPIDSITTGLRMFINRNAT